MQPCPSLRFFRLLLTKRSPWTFFKYTFFLDIVALHFRQLGSAFYIIFFSHSHHSSQQLNGICIRRHILCCTWISVGNWPCHGKHASYTAIWMILCWPLFATKKLARFIVFVFRVLNFEWGFVCCSQKCRMSHTFGGRSSEALQTRVYHWNLPILEHVSSFNLESTAPNSIIMIEI